MALANERRQENTGIVVRIPVKAEIETGDDVFLFDQVFAPFRNTILIDGLYGKIKTTGQAEALWKIIKERNLCKYRLCCN